MVCNDICIKLYVFKALLRTLTFDRKIDVKQHIFCSVKSHIVVSQGFLFLSKCPNV